MCFQLKSRKTKIDRNFYSVARCTVKLANRAICATQLHVFEQFNFSSTVYSACAAVLFTAYTSYVSVCFMKIICLSNVFRHGHYLSLVHQSKIQFISGNDTSLYLATFSKNQMNQKISRKKRWKP